MSVTQPYVFVSKADIDAALASPPTLGKRLLEPLKSLAAASGLPMNVLEDHAVENDPEVHPHEGDLWHCLQGEVAFVCGGRLAKPQMRSRPDGSPNDLEIWGTSIAGGTEVTLTPGDWLWIPAGQPHLHRTAGTARLVIIKIPANASAVVPLEAVL